MTLTCPECGAGLDVGSETPYPMPPTCTVGQLLHYVWVWRDHETKGKTHRKRELVSVNATSDLTPVAEAIRRGQERNTPTPA